MADFSSGFWDLYVAGFTAFGLLLCLVLMFANRGTQSSGAPQMKGHVWDETLKEYNNPLPRWWFYLFLGTVVFSVAYLVIYPGFGSMNSTPGKDTGLRVEHAKEVKDAQTLDKYLSVNLATLATDKNAMATGQRLFVTYCAQCHGSSGKGSKGYPDLTDNDWLYGGDPETIKTSIEGGRSGMMAPFGTGEPLNSDQVKDLANYVRSLSGLSADSARAAQGKEVFAARCVTCHGQDGKGALAMGAGALGAPDLTDKVWLFGDSEETIIEGITKGRNAGPGSLANEMPAWKDFLGDAKVHVLAAYVYSLSK
jgi:cytochrome c oxidase cbb3-type subunit 3